MANSTVGKIIVQAVIGFAAAAVGMPAQAHAIGPCEAMKHKTPSKRGPYGRPPLAIGDSVMLGAVPQIARAGVEVDARGCRQAGAALALMRARKRRGTLPRVVVLHIGTNGAIRSGHVRAALRIAGPRRLLVLMTATGPNGPRSSAVMRAAARRHPGRTRLVDWARASAGRGWFAGDGIHLSAAGAAAMARMLEPLTRVVPPEPPPCPS